MGGPGEGRPPGGAAARRTVCLVGPGWRFTSGISYYTCRLAGALADRHDVSVILMRQLLPRRFYPGRERVGLPRARARYPAGLPVCVVPVESTDFDATATSWPHAERCSAVGHPR